MKNIILLLSILFISISTYAQEMNMLLSKYNEMSVPYIKVQTLKIEYDKYTVLDTRKKAEYEVSHLPGAIWAGENLDVSLLKNVSKEKPIVVYCSIGVRSEDFGEELLEEGYENVYNLYGSIFSWKDEGCPVVDMNEEETDQVHVYSKEWGKYLKTGEKVY